MSDIQVTAASDIEIDKDALDASIAEFAERNSDYYIEVFHKIHNRTGWLPNTFNVMAALCGPLWAGARAVWGFFWTFLLLEMIAWVQIGRGLWGDLGADEMAKIERFTARAAEMREKAAAAVAEGADPSRYEAVAGNMERAIAKAQEAADVASAQAMSILVTGLVLLAVFKLVQGLWANVTYEKQYSRWRIDRSVESGFSTRNLVLGAILVAVIAPLTIYRFTVSAPWELITAFPEKQIVGQFISAENESLYTLTAKWFDEQFNALARNYDAFFDSITWGIRTVLDALIVALNGTPWPVVMAVILVSAWRLAGPRVAIFTAAVLTYVALYGYWEESMDTVALVGAAALFCVIVGIPLGIWFGKKPGAYRIAEPILDLMQTLPAFVYLIPIIALLGTGNPPGVFATIFFGMPPVVRLTALGMRGVPEPIKEAATAFGASRWQVLRDVEIPLALPSIMAGVNQTILMCLSMVVIISLIGGQGLGKVILEALQYVAKGQGLLGGLAILFVAMVMDRIVQGAFKRKDQK